MVPVIVINALWWDWYTHVEFEILVHCDYPGPRCTTFRSRSNFSVDRRTRTEPPLLPPLGLPSPIKAWLYVNPMPVLVTDWSRLDLPSFYDEKVFAWHWVTETFLYERQSTVTITRNLILKQQRWSSKQHGEIDINMETAVMRLTEGAAGEPSGLGSSLVLLLLIVDLRLGTLRLGIWPHGLWLLP